MRVFPMLLLLFFLVPLGEIYLLIQVGDAVGALPTIALVVFTAVLGAALVRSQGLSTISRLQRNLEEGGLPAVPLIEGAMILFAGALLLTPGFITDAIGFACLVPPLRQSFAHWLISRGALHVASTGSFHTSGQHPPGGQPGGQRPTGEGRVIEGEYRREDE